MVVVLTKSGFVSPCFFVCAYGGGVCEVYFRDTYLSIFVCEINGFVYKKLDKCCRVPADESQ